MNLDSSMDSIRAWLGVIQTYSCICSFHGESYKLNAGRETFWSLTNQVVLQIESKSWTGATFLLGTQPRAELGFKPTAPDTSFRAAFPTPCGPHKHWDQGSSLLLPPNEAIPGEFLPAFSGRSGEFPPTVPEQGDVFTVGTEVKISHHKQC